MHYLRCGKIMFQERKFGKLKIYIVEICLYSYDMAVVIKILTNLLEQYQISQYLFPILRTDRLQFFQHY